MFEDSLKKSQTTEARWLSIDLLFTQGKCLVNYSKFYACLLGQMSRFKKGGNENTAPNAPPNWFRSRHSENLR
jgi:hypothetical protein